MENLNSSSPEIAKRPNVFKRFIGGISTTVAEMNREIAAGLDEGSMTIGYDTSAGVYAPKIVRTFREEEL
jgi:hypothetical protein